MSQLGKAGRVALSALGVFRRLILVLLLAVSLAFNVAILVSSTVVALASSAVSAVTGARTVFLQQADEIAELSNRVDTERLATRELRSEVAATSADLNAERLAHRQTRSQLSDVSADLDMERVVLRQTRSELADTANALDAERLVLRQTRSELAEASADLATSSRLIRSEARDAAAEIVEGISDRTARTARREVAAMSAESIPFWGTAIIVGATTLELRDMCQNMLDLRQLQELFDPTTEHSEDLLEVCGIEVPTRNEIWEAARNSPQQAWTAAQVAMPTMEEIRTMELPDINWTDLGTSISESSRGWADTAASAAGDVGDWFVNWWNN
jgi:hypothetical protein